MKHDQREELNFDSSAIAALERRRIEYIQKLVSAGKISAKEGIDRIKSVDPEYQVEEVFSLTEEDLGGRPTGYAEFASKVEPSLMAEAGGGAPVSMDTLFEKGDIPAVVSDIERDTADLVERTLSPRLQSRMRSARNRVEAYLIDLESKDPSIFYPGCENDEGFMIEASQMVANDLRMPAAEVKAAIQDYLESR